jgi:hypothetical protein
LRGWKDHERSGILARFDTERSEAVSPSPHYGNVCRMNLRYPAGPRPFAWLPCGWVCPTTEWLEWSPQRCPSADSVQTRRRAVLVQGPTTTRRRCSPRPAGWETTGTTRWAASPGAYLLRSWNSGRARARRWCPRRRRRPRPRRRLLLRRGIACWRPTGGRGVRVRRSVAAAPGGASETSCSTRMRAVLRAARRSRRSPATRSPVPCRRTASPPTSGRGASVPSHAAAAGSRRRGCRSAVQITAAGHAASSMRCGAKGLATRSPAT